MSSRPYLLPSRQLQASTMQAHSYHTFYSNLCGAMLLLGLTYGCANNPPKIASQADSLLTTPQTVAARTGTEVSTPTTAQTPRTIRVKEATLVLAFNKPVAAKLCNKFVPEELLATLYESQIKSDETGTLVIEDISVGALDVATNTYLAVVKTAKEDDADEDGTGNCVLDIFAFRDTTSAHPVIAHTQYEPEYPDVQLGGIQGKKYQISDDEFAVAFDWTHEQRDVQSVRTSAMLCLFRINGDVLEPLFELCTSNKLSSNLVENGKYEIISDDRATLETMKTWGKDLYSILVTRRQTLQSTAEAANHAEKHTTKTLYQWDGTRYVETNQLL
jgi:hypothetical protein